MASALLACGGPRPVIPLLRQLVTFGSVGGLSTMITAVLFALLARNTDLPATVSMTAAFCAGLGISFIGHSRLTFRDVPQAQLGVTLPRFLVTAAISYTLNTLAAYLIVDTLHAHYAWALVVMIVPIPLIVFGISKFWVFGSPSP